MQSSPHRDWQQSREYERQGLWYQPLAEVPHCTVICNQMQGLLKSYLVALQPKQPGQTRRKKCMGQNTRCTWRNIQTGPRNSRIHTCSDAITLSFCGGIHKLRRKSGKARIHRIPRFFFVISIY